MGSSPTRATKEVNLKKTIDQNFFKNWTRESAYLIGYICSDGCVHKRSGRNRSYVLTITSKDKEHLEKIRALLKSDYAISRKIGGTGSISYNLTISNSAICLDLISLGILPRKTLILTKLSVPGIFRADFVRGFFDADGSVYIYKVSGTPQLKIGLVSASLGFIKFLAGIICEDLNLPPKSIHRFLNKNRVNPMYSIDFYINDGKKLFDFMYKDNPVIFLARKYSIFIKWNSFKRRKYVLVDL